MFTLTFCRNVTCYKVIQHHFNLYHNWRKKKHSPLIPDFHHDTQCVYCYFILLKLSNTLHYTGNECAYDGILSWSTPYLSIILLPFILYCKVLYFCVYFYHYMGVHKGVYTSRLLVFSAIHRDVVAAVLPSIMHYKLVYEPFTLLLYTPRYKLMYTS